MFQNHRTSGPEEEKNKAFYHIWHGGHLGHVTWTIYMNCSDHLRLHIIFGSDRQSGFRVDV